MEWTRTQGAISALPAGSCQVSDLSNATAGPGWTLLRVHFLLQVPFAAATDSSLFGLILARDTDLGTSAGRAPNPLNDAALGWRFWTKCMPGASGAAVDTEAVFSFDIKSKVKIGNGVNTKLVYALHNANAAAATYAFAYSALWALP
jgi:hypothetical protein